MNEQQWVEEIATDVKQVLLLLRNANKEVDVTDLKHARELLYSFYNQSSIASRSSLSPQFALAVAQFVTFMDTIALLRRRQVNSYWVMWTNCRELEDYAHFIAQKKLRVYLNPRTHTVGFVCAMLAGLAKKAAAEKWFFQCKIVSPEQARVDPECLLRADKIVLYVPATGTCWPWLQRAIRALPASTLASYEPLFTTRIREGASYVPDSDDDDEVMARGGSYGGFVSSVFAESLRDILLLRYKVTRINLAHLQEFEFNTLSLIVTNDLVDRLKKIKDFSEWRRLVFSH